MGKSTVFGLHFYCMEEIDKADFVGMEGAVNTRTSVNRRNYYGFLS